MFSPSSLDLLPEHRAVWPGSFLSLGLGFIVFYKIEARPSPLLSPVNVGDLILLTELLVLFPFQNVLRGHAEGVSISKQL